MKFLIFLSVLLLYLPLSFKGDCIGLVKRTERGISQFTQTSSKTDSTKCYLIKENTTNNTIIPTTMKKIIKTDSAPAAIGPYSQAVQYGNILFVSGQLGLDPLTGEFAGKGVKEQTLQIFKNINAILTEAGYALSDIVKTTVFLTDMNDFAVVNEIYAAQFEGHFPARSAVAVKTLPKNGLVEIEVIAAK